MLYKYITASLEATGFWDNESCTFSGIAATFFTKINAVITSIKNVFVQVPNYSSWGSHEIVT